MSFVGRKKGSPGGTGCHRTSQQGLQGLMCSASSRHKCPMWRKPEHAAIRGPAATRVALVAQERQLGVGERAQTHKTGDNILSVCAKHESKHLENALQLLGRMHW